MTAYRRGIGLALFALLTFAGTAPAQEGTHSSVRAEVGDESRAIEPVPFGPGERMEYAVELSPFGIVGEGAMEIVGLDMIRGHRTYHLRFDLEGSVAFVAKVDDRMESWLDVSGLYSLRFHQDQDEVNYERVRTLNFFPDEGVWRAAGSDNSGPLATDRPLDEVSFVYFVRSLPLEVGETYRFNRYYEEEGNPVVIKVLGHEIVTVPAGTFRTVVVRPIIETSGLFGKGGQAKIYFTADERRILVQMTSDVPVLGSLNLYLTSYTPGRELSPSSTRPAHASR